MKHDHFYRFLVSRTGALIVVMHNRGFIFFKEKTYENERKLQRK